MSEDERELESWLRRMRWALASLSDIERDDIVAETRAHLSERIAQGTPTRAALDAFGPAEAYALHFVDERELSGAAGSQRPAAMLGAIVRRAHRSVVAAIAFFIVIGLGTVAFAAVLTAIVKILDPIHAGLWLGKTQFFLGVIANPGVSRELLGNWIYPFAALGVAISWLAGRAVLVWAVTTLARTG
jgi:uncharacterized membrane protein